MSDDFEARLENAIRRGQQRGQVAANRQRQAELSEEELRRMHRDFQLSLSDRIEKAIHRVADHFPGFRNESLFGEAGWGTACYRDDLKLDAGKRSNLYSRLEIVVRPYSDMKVLDMKAKGTVVNREIFARSHYARLADVDITEFEQLIDAWAIEFAERYAASSK